MPDSRKARRIADPGLQPERTSLAWFRTMLGYGALMALAIKHNWHQAGMLFWISIGILAIVALILWHYTRNRNLMDGVILNESNIDSVLLEDGDVINIPEKTSLVMVHGEVLFPNAVSWQKGMTTEDYIEKCGGLTQKSGNARIIVIRQNGAAVNAEDVDSLKPGDEIMVLPKYESKNIEVTRGISTILYQLAVGAKVILSL